MQSNPELIKYAIDKIMSIYHDGNQKMIEIATKKPLGDTQNNYYFICDDNKCNSRYCLDAQQ